MLYHNCKLTNRPPVNPCFRVIKAVIVSFLTISISVNAVWGQAASRPDVSLRQRNLDEPFRLKMDKQVPADKRMIFDWGGWFRSNYWGLDENTHRTYWNHIPIYDGNGNITNNARIINENGYHGLRQQQLRVWGFLNIDQVHQFYARGRLDYYDWNSGTSFDSNDSDLDGVNMDRLWYDFRLSRAQNAYGQEVSEFDVAARIGRQYVEFGNGLTLSIPLDAALINGYYGNWQITGLAGKSVPSAHNYVEPLIPDRTREDRCFWGVQLRYQGNPDHEPFAYFLSQEDHNDGYQAYGQQFGLDSRYFGIGSRGQFFHRDLQYAVEIVGEVGKSCANCDCANSPEVNTPNIHAWAFDTELKWLLPNKRRTEYTVEYLWASGDHDRQFTDDNPFGLNRKNTTDDAFSGWGYRNTGLVLAPHISNLGMFKLGGATFPFTNVNALQQMQIGINYFLFHKHQANSYISDVASVEHHNYLGSEFDFFTNFNITSDMTFSLHYGIFLPGQAFSSQRDRHLLFTGLTFSF